MQSNTAPADAKPPLDFAEINEIAANIVQWRRRQAEAFSQMPLTYVDCLLDQIAEAEYVAWEDIPEEVGALVPWLDSDTCRTLVSVYLDRSTAIA